MSPLRNNLENARREYESTRYRGNLALNVLGRDTAGNEASPMRIAPARRRFFAPLAIAAALAIGLGVGIFAGRAMRPEATREIAKDVPTPTQFPQGSTTLPTAQPTKTLVTAAPETIVAPNSPTTSTEDFTLVPTADSFSDQAVSVVPNLAALEAEANAQTTDTTVSNTAVTANDVVASAPMSLLLLSMDEYSDQQAAADAKTKSTSPVTNTSSEDRS